MMEQSINRRESLKLMLLTGLTLGAGGCGLDSTRDYQLGLEAEELGFKATLRMIDLRGAYDTVRSITFDFGKPGDYVVEVYHVAEGGAEVQQGLWRFTVPAEGESRNILPDNPISTSNHRMRVTYLGFEDGVKSVSLSLGQACPVAVPEGPAEQRKERPGAA